MFGFKIAAAILGPVVALIAVGIAGIFCLKRLHHNRLCHEPR